jgi:hypothetical protein
VGQISEQQEKEHRFTRTLSEGLNRVFRRSPMASQRQMGALQELAEDIVLEYEEAMLDWGQQEDNEESDRGAESDLEYGPTGEELLQVLGRVLAPNKALEVPEEKSVKCDLPKEVVYVWCIAVVIREDTSKTDWDLDC